MSRIGRRPIELPKGVALTVTEGVVRAKGPKGELAVNFDPSITVRQEGTSVLIERQNDERDQRSLHGLTRTLVANAVTGVSEGYSRDLELHGVGFRARLNGKNLELSIGYSHPVVVEPPAGITFAVPEPTRITISGIDKQLVGQVAANVRETRKPDAYHGKGVRYAGERIVLKPGKAASGGKGKK